MKRLILTLAAAAALAAPMAVATTASAQPHRGGDHSRGYERHGNDHRGYNGRGYDGRAYYGRGYYAPPARYYAPPVWRRGGYLPPAYSGYYISDYGRYGLRPPPRGYRWNRVGNDYLLTAIATGLIFDIVTR